MKRKPKETDQILQALSPMLVIVITQEVFSKACHFAMPAVSTFLSDWWLSGEIMQIL